MIAESNTPLHRYKEISYMWNGFYSVDSLDIDKLRMFYSEALAISIKSYVDIKYSNSFHRVLSDMLPEFYIQNRLSLASHNIVVNRYEYNGCADWAPKTCEIGSSVFDSEESYYLYIILDIDKFDMLISKYNLSKI